MVCWSASSSPGKIMPRFAVFAHFHGVKTESHHDGLQGTNRLGSHDRANGHGCVLERLNKSTLEVKVEEGARVLVGISVPLEGHRSMDKSSALPYLILVHVVAHGASFRVCVLSPLHRQSILQGEDGGMWGQHAPCLPTSEAPPCGFPTLPPSPCLQHFTFKPSHMNTK